MTPTQAQMFPLTEEERMAAIRATLAKKEEAAKIKRDSAFVALDEATEKWTEAAAMLETFDAMHGVVEAARAAIATPDGVDPVTGEVDPSDRESDDELFSDAVEVVRATGAASVALLQRRLSIGYAQAAALLDRMEAKGIVDAPEPGSKSRAVLDPEGVHATVTMERGSGGVIDDVLDETAKQINAGAMGPNVTAIVRPAS